jgi:hypothetical protein
MGGKRARSLGIEDVRELALALPDTSEKPSYGTPGFRVADKLFARVLDDFASIVVFVDLDQREMLVASQPQIFSVTPHYQGYPMVIVQLATVGRGLLADLLEEAWRLRAPARLTARGGSGSGSRRPR